MLIAERWKPGFHPRTKRNEAKRNETKRNETERNGTERNSTKRNETNRSFFGKIRKYEKDGRVFIDPIKRNKNSR